MKMLLQWLLAVVPMSGMLAGCQFPKASANPAARSTRNNCYSLLYELLNEEKDVNKLHYLKHEQADVKDLLKRVAQTSAAGSKELEMFAGQDPTIVLADNSLPAGEKSTRDAIASDKTWELLGESGDEFEVTLLLSQTEALTYGWHLAKVAANHESDPQRAKYLEKLSAELKDLDHELTALLLSRMSSAPAAPKTNNNVEL